MSTIDITYGQNNSDIHLEIPVISIIELKLRSIEVIKGFVAGTDSNKWLIEAEDNNG